MHPVAAGREPVFRLHVHRLYGFVYQHTRHPQPGGSMARFTLTQTLAVVALCSLAAFSSARAEAPTVLHHIVDESIHPDHVVQPGETVEFRITVQGLDEPWTNVTWTLSLPHPELELSTTSGTLAIIPAGDTPTTLLSVTLNAGTTGSLPERTPWSLTIEATEGTMTHSATLSLNQAEVLLIADGMAGVRETLGPDLEAANVVWGFAGVPIDELPADMFGAYVLMIEADGRYSEVLFTDQDGPVRDWFRFGYGGGSISGLYLHDIYPNADPSWLGGIGGEWPDAAPDTLFEGIPDDAIAAGRTVQALSPDGISVCFPCCGNPANFYTSEGDAVAGWVDYGWRIVDYGFSLVHLREEDAVDLSRSGLVDRTANWLLFREAGVNDDPPATVRPSHSELISLYPNPFNASLTVNIIPVSAVAPLHLRIVNTLGRTVTSETLAPGTTRWVWQANEYPSGHYLILSNQAGETSAQRATLLR